MINRKLVMILIIKYFKMPFKKNFRFLNMSFVLIGYMIDSWKLLRVFAK